MHNIIYLMISPPLDLQHTPFPNHLDHQKMEVRWWLKLIILSIHVISICPSGQTKINALINYMHRPNQIVGHYHMVQQQPRPKDDEETAV